MTSRPRLVILVGNYAADGQQSMIRFGQALDQALRTVGISTYHWHPPSWFARWAGINRESGNKWIGYVDKFILGCGSLLWLRCKHPNALWHIMDHGNAGYSWALPRQRTLITAHDCFALVAWKEGRVGSTGALLQRWIASGLRRARLVAAVSQQTATELLPFGIAASRIHVVHNALNRPYQIIPETVAEQRLAEAGIPFDRPFIFHIGSNQWYKNRIGLVRIFAALRADHPAGEWRLVMAGKPWPVALREVIAASGVAHDIHDAGTISDAALEACYNYADAVVIPSLGEGFGWPVAEAQACGAVVIASDRAPLPEVGGDGAHYCDPLDVPRFAQAILGGIRDREPLSAAALANVQRFAPSTWAAAYAGLYQLLELPDHP